LNNPYDARIGGHHTAGSFHPGINSVIDQAAMDLDFARPMPAPTAPAGTVSSDILRHPLSGRARHLLEKAMHIAELGQHGAAIEALRDALVKRPDAAPYIHSLLGIEYLETHQLAEAVKAFGEAARVMPHESATHSNLGLSLAASGSLDLAEKELHTALDLDATNEKAKVILEAVLVVRRSALPPAP
jgi:Flp pilus assembly protein TadD